MRSIDTRVTAAAAADAAALVPAFPPGNLADRVALPDDPPDTARAAARAAPSRGRPAP